MLFIFSNIYLNLVYAVSSIIAHQSRLIIVFITLYFLIVSPAIFAEGDDAANAGPAAIYLPIKPPFVVNYGGKGKLKYLKTELSVRLDTADAANAVRHHMPYVRNNLVMLFAAQTDEDVTSQEGKEQLRQNALQVIRDLLVQEEDLNPESVIDLYFNNFIVQK